MMVATVMNHMLRGSEYDPLFTGGWIEWALVLNLVEVSAARKDRSDSLCWNDGDCDNCEHNDECPVPAEMLQGVLQKVEEEKDEE